jgi:DNA recombination protein RmuC
MTQLSAKSYWDSLEVTPDFVAMFIPGDNFFAAALERDRSLFKDAVEKRVLIVTPTTLIALLKSIAYGWRREEAHENTQKVLELGKEMHKRLATLGTHIVALGKSIDDSAGKYNSMIGSLQRQVLPWARRFTELGVESSGKEIPEIGAVETQTDQLRDDSPLLEGRTKPPIN